MPCFPQPRAVRAPRLRLHETVSVIVQLENGRNLPAKLHRVSITGGLLELSTYLEERTRVDLTFQLGFAFVHPKGETLFPMRGGDLGYLQPFRVTSFAEEERHRLQMEIADQLKQALTPGKSVPGLTHPRFLMESV
ncbi:MAG TPA: hypothetical protein VKA07_08795 [Candidatus Sulfotelmatobacter sp.]|nr:hypothetical protein [Candidatus Sulfotelmatobacter sp.]